MIINEDIKPNEIIKVLVNEDDIEEEVYAIVQDNRGDHLELKYIEETDKRYKDALIYAFSDNIEVIYFDNILEHYQDVYDVSEIDMLKVRENMYVFLEEVDIEDDDDEIRTIPDDGEYSLDSFVVADDEVEEEIEKPRDAKQIDREWNEWNPTSPGARSFKDTIDMIECRIKHQIDEKNAFN